MKEFSHGCRAFTLIELVATLMLGGVLAVGGAGLIIYVVQGYNTVRDHASLAQGVELALGRLEREVRRADAIAGGGTSVTITRDGVARTFDLVNGTIVMQVDGVAYPLMREVSDFSVQRTTSGETELVEISITPNVAGPVFSTGHWVVPEGG